jgi:hypothetical protein
MNMDADKFFEGYPESKPLFDALCEALDKLSPFEMQVTKSQIAFRRRKAFAWVWVPARYLRRKSAPLVLTMGFRYRQSSPRWKEIVEPRPGYFTHHLELYSVTDINDEVVSWLRSAWESAA